jgi:hemolysin D
MSLNHKVAAYADLLQHYRATFRHHWQHRSLHEADLFTQQEAEFLPSAISLQEQPVSPAARLVGRTLMVLVATALIWSIVGKVDIIVNATGKIIPSGRTKTIGSVDVASVRAIHVEEGQKVKAGEVLIELDSSASDAERDKAIGDVTQAKLEVARSRALIHAVDTLIAPTLPTLPDVPEADRKREQHHLDGQYLDFLTKLKKLNADIQQFEQALPIATKLAHDYKTLSDSHDVSYHAYLEKEQARIQLVGQLDDAKNQRATLVADTKYQAYETLTQGEKLASESQADALKAGSHSKLLKLRSPIDGTVQQLMVHTVGGVVPAAQPLMQIVPSRSVIEVEGKIKDKDVGFVKEGQSVEVKIDAFEYTKYGTIPGHVVHVSKDAVEDDKKNLSYLVDIDLDQSFMMVDGHKKPLGDGMSVNAEIKTGSRRIIEYILSPVLQNVHESINER